MAQTYIGEAALAASSPYRLKVTQDGARFVLLVDGHGGNQYGSMDAPTARRIYRMYRDAWLRAQAEELAA